MTMLFWWKKDECVSGSIERTQTLSIHSFSVTMSIFDRLNKGSKSRQRKAYPLTTTDSVTEVLEQRT